jgi:RNA polymerase sigma-70 factor (ECF subfamily)
MASADDSNATRPSLLLRLRDPHDAESWRTFVTLYGPLILRYARQHGLQDADAADVTQDVLAQVARSIRGFTYQPERGRFRDWLGTVVRHRVFRLQKAEAGRPQAVGGGPDGWLDTLPAVEQDTEWTAAFNAHVLHAALERARPHFEPATWEAFRLAWLEQQTAAAAAGRLGLTIDAVYVAKSRVLKRLRTEVALLAEDLPLDPR